LARHVYKYITGQSIDFKDLKHVDKALYKSLRNLLTAPIHDDIGLTFTDDSEMLSENKTVDLKAHGSKEVVTEANKYEYVKLKIQQKLVGAVNQQLDAIKKGFSEVIPSEQCDVLSGAEFEALLCGVPQIEVQEWERHTAYRGYTASSPQVQWFWQFVRSLTPSELSKLFYFCTSISRLSVQGFESLPHKFTIICDGDPHFQQQQQKPLDKLPSSHTCFHQLLLPPYADYETLAMSCSRVLDEVEGFGFI